MNLGEKQLENKTQIAEIFNCLNSERRITAFEKLGKGKTINEIADEENMSYSGVHSYVSDYAEVGLIEKRNSDYQITEVGEMIYEGLEEFDEITSKVKKERIKSVLKKGGYDLDNEEDRELLNEILESTSE